AALWASPLLAKETLDIFHAGSLSAPMQAMEEAFEKAHPDVDILREAGGSAALARKIIDLGGKCDLYFTADYMVIERLLRPEFADWNVLFASNELVLMYAPESAYADEINGENWYDILLREDVRWGHSDADADPCGYRSLMVLQLASEYYGVPDLYERAMKHEKRAVRPKAIDLIAMVESGAMDYAFEYRSVAVQHGLKYVELPAKINLKDPQYKDFYATAEVERAGATPGSTIITKGQPVVYGCTMPLGGEQKELALKFMEFALSPEGGLKILEDMGQGIVGPQTATPEDALPEALKSYMK
ncbi:MAG TPA: tungstate ABC transporter substrate-binding protein WtpA, partial [Synergistaceae bacterium]|nr:tungstate ABC transporter substrate-binding protein WtpA [Synergistaceae bacterium]